MPCLHDEVLAAEAGVSISTDQKRKQVGNCLILSIYDFCEDLVRALAHIRKQDDGITKL